MNSSEFEKLGDPEDALVNNGNGPDVDGNEENSVKVQDIKSLEISFKHEATIVLPQTLTMEMAPTVELTTAIMDVPSGPPVTRHESVFRRNPDPKFENGVKKIGTVDPGFNGACGVVPLTASTALVHSANKINLVDIEKGEIQKRYTPDANFLRMHVLDEKNLILEDMVDHVLLSMQLNDDTDSDIEPFITTIDKTTNTNETIQMSTLVKSGEVVTCVVRETNCLICRSKKVQYIKHYDPNGSIRRIKKLKKDGKNVFLYSVIAMAGNGNGDICIACQTADEDWDDTSLVVINEDFDFRFTYPKEGYANSEGKTLHDVATDPFYNILVGYIGLFDLIDVNGNYLKTIVADFGVDGRSSYLSVDSEGKAWICTETGRVVVIEYSSLKSAT